MIQVKRGPAPSCLVGPTSKGGIETDAAIKAARKKGDFTFTFAAYKDPEVVTALRALFRKKCAYCEFFYAPGGPEDVEHFRPKGAVVVRTIVKGKPKETLTKPGYYWLAASWANLLPSCIDCNRKREKELEGKARGMSGKANLFPVVDERRRWRSHSKPNKEEILLLDPCSDDPELHLEFAIDGTVQAKRNSKKTPSARGAATIEVFGLHRGDLVGAREQLATKLRSAIERARSAAEIAETEPSATKRVRIDKLASELLGDVKAYLEPDQPFLATARAVCRANGIRP